MINNKSYCVKTNESTMDIKHASDIIWLGIYLFISFFSLEQVDIESKQGIHMLAL